MSSLINIDDCFNKRYEFSNNSKWFLPSEAYKSRKWQIEALEQLKIELNEVKSQLNKFNLEQWSQHTRFRDPTRLLISTLRSKSNFELLTQAWCKFYECLNQFQIVPEIVTCVQSLQSFHLCEAPGAFITSLCRFLYLNHRNVEWKWFANSLNPYYEGNSSDMVADDRLIRHSLEQWEFGVDDTGDITKFYNHEKLVGKTTGVLLVTADGSVDCMRNPGEQENTVHFLNYCETMTALKILEKFGSFVLKLFTMFEHGTICLMYLLNCCFGRVCVFKPSTSKSGNSEVYVVCLEYKGWPTLERLWETLIEPYKKHSFDEDLAMFGLEEINSDFLRQIAECGLFFMQGQVLTINQNISYFISKTSHDGELDIEELKRKTVEFYLNRYKIAFHIPKRCNLIKNNRKKKPSRKCLLFEELCFENGVDDVTHLLFIKIGLELNKITTTQFCQVNFDNERLQFDNDSIIEGAKMFLPLNYIKIQVEPQSNQSLYQRAVFSNIVSVFNKSENDIVIVGVPLLTRFLVGLIYILASGFKSLNVYYKGVLIFHNPKSGRLKNIIATHFETIKNAFCSLNEKRFKPDILEVVSDKYLVNGEFYDAICRYNNGLFET